VAAYVSVGQAARALGVTSDTVRRWTSTGLLPCVRTAGGHRRIAREDVEELRRAIGASGHLEARRAREREADTLAQASIDLVSVLDRQELLATIARHVTRLCECHSCAISEYHADGNFVRILAEFDSRGHRLPEMTDFDLAGFPVTRRVLADKVPVVVNADDHGADPAEVRLLRRYGDKSVLMVPLVFRDQAIGLLEAVDWERPRRYTPQELRLVKALAGHAAVALRNAELFGEGQQVGGSQGVLVAELAGLGRELTGLGDLGATTDWPGAVAQIAVRVFQACSCLITCDGGLVGAVVAPPPGSKREDAVRGAAEDREARGLRSAGAGRAGRYEITLTLLRPVVAGEADLLALLAALLARLV